CVALCYFFFYSFCLPIFFFFSFFFTATATSEIYTLSLHDALPISSGCANQLLPIIPIALLFLLTYSTTSFVDFKKNTSLAVEDIPVSFRIWLLKLEFTLSKT